MRILVVDDDEEMLLLAGFLLGRDGRFAPVTALGGRAALESARAERPDAVVTDFRMAGLDGLDFMRALRALPGMRKTPVVVCSGGRQADFREQCLAAGAAGFIAKPFDPATFAGDLFLILGGGGNARAKGAGSA